MKKNIFAWIIILTVISLGTLGCSNSKSSDDETEQTNSKKQSVSIVGTWKYNFSSGYVLLTFDKNNQGRYQEWDHNEWQSDESFSYNYSNNMLQWSLEDGDIEIISLSNGKLILKDWPDGGANTFIRQ